MRAIRSVAVALALSIAGAGAAWAQQPYPKQFASQWQDACMTSCQGNALYKGREGLCQSYCSCIIEEVQAKVPLEVALQADKDMAAKNNTSEAVQRVNAVTHQCQARVLPPQQQPAGQTKAKR